MYENKMLNAFRGILGTFHLIFIKWGWDISIDENSWHFYLKNKRNTTAVDCLITIKTAILPTEKKVESILEKDSHKIHKYRMIGPLVLLKNMACQVLFKTKLVLLPLTNGFVLL